MSVAYKRIDADNMMLKFGDRYTFKGRSGTVGTVVEQNGRPVAADFRPDGSGKTERIVLETPRAAPVQRTAPVQRSPAPTVNEFERLADGMFQSVRSYVDSRFSDIIKYLPSGTEHRQEMIADVSNEIERLLEDHRKAIADDVAYLRQALTRLDSLEQRIKLLESPRSFQSNAA